MTDIIDDQLTISDPTNAEYTLSDGTNSSTIQTPTLSGSSNFILPTSTGTTGEGLTWGASGVTEWGTVGGSISNWIIRDVKTSGTDGGTFTAGAWQTRDLNTLTKPSGVGTEVQLAVSPATTNQLRIEAGTYRIFAIACCGDDPEQNKCKLRNITDSTDTLIGSSARAPSGGSGNSLIHGFFTIASTKVFELQHRCTSTTLTSGFGDATGVAGVSEVYSSIYIEKIA